MTIRRILTTHIFLISCSLFSLSCNLFTGPSESGTPGRRDYIWTVDTLSPSSAFGPSVYHLRAIWGSSPTDVWTGGTLHNTPQYNLFHFDGTQWVGWQVPTDFWTICGFASNDIWIGGGGAGGEIWHFDGSGWNKKLNYRPPDSYDVIVQDINGMTPDDVYAVGTVFLKPGNLNIQRGLILHYDGSVWKEVYTSNYQSQFGRVRVDGKGVVYLWGVQYIYTPNGDTELTETQLLFQFENGVMRRMYSDSAKGTGFVMVDEIGSNAYFVLSHDIYRYVPDYSVGAGSFSRGSFVKLFSINDTQFDGQIYGRGENDVFVTLYDGIAHWNGTDLKRLLSFSNNFTFIPTPAIFDSEVFFCVSDGLNNVNMVAHGKLTD